MNKNLIIIILAGVVVLNFILITLLGKSNKRSSRDAKKKEESSYKDSSEDFEAKTEIIGRSREIINENSKKNTKEDSNENLEGRITPSNVSDSKASFDRIPDLSDSVKKKIVNETMIEAKPEEANETEVMTFEEKEKTYAVLSFFQGDEEVTFEMKKQEMYIGRDPEQCDLVISSDKYLGRRHARFYTENEKIFVEDLDTKNGTYVDNKKITGSCEVALGKFKVASTEISIK